MTRTTTRLGAFLAFLVLVAAQAPSASAARPGPAVSGVIGAPPPGKALVVFYRPSKFLGDAVDFDVREGGTVLGKLRSGRYFVSAVEPGPHAYTVPSEANGVVNLQVAAGETHFVRAAIRLGFDQGHPRLSPSDEAAFAKALKRLRLAEQDDRKGGGSAG